MSAYFRLGRALVFVALVLAGAGTVHGDEPKTKIKSVPESIDDLRAIETQVQKVVAKVSPCTVAVHVGSGQGSGVVVSADGLVATAGHVSMTPGEKALVVFPNGKKLRATTLGRNGGLDSGMVKIDSGGPFPFVEMGKSSLLKAGQWCIAVGHPGGFRENRAPVVRLGRLLFVSNSFLRTDAAIVGGDSGGPLFDMDGKLIGIHSRISRSITENLHVPIDTYRQTWDRLVRGDSWGGDLGLPSRVKSAGGKVILEEKSSLTATDAHDPKFTESFHKKFTVRFEPGHAYTITMRSRTKNFDCFLRLEDPSGKQLAENDDGGGEDGERGSHNDARIVYRPSRGGEYRIYATTFEPRQTGSFTITVQQADIVAADLPGGEINILQVLKMPKQVAPQLVSQLARGGVPLFANAHLFDASGKPISERDLTFRWKGGKAVHKTDDQGQVRLKLTRERVEELSLDVPTGMKALVQLTDEEGNPPPVKLNFQKDKTSGPGEIVLKKEGRLDAKVGAKADADASRHTYAFELRSGSTYIFDLESSDFDVVLRIEGVPGKKIESESRGTGVRKAHIEHHAEADSACRIVVASSQPQATGQFALVVRKK